MLHLPVWFNKSVTSMSVRFASDYLTSIAWGVASKVSSHP